MGGVEKIGLQPLSPLRLRLWPEY